MIGPKYWTTGIMLTYVPAYTVRSVAMWSGSLDFCDDGFADDSVEDRRISTEGQLRTRYLVQASNPDDALTAVIDVLIADAERLGINFSHLSTGATLYVKGDGEDAFVPLPANWRDVLHAQCQRLGWRSAYQPIGVTT